MRPSPDSPEYESDIKADSFLVMARGSAEEVERAKTILETSNPSRVDIHRVTDAVAETPADAAA